MATKPLQRITIGPGELCVSDDPDTVIVTLLGSCVAACLYDEQAGVFGMNHFLLASRGQNQSSMLNTDAGRYGVNAMELLINDLLKAGARRQRLKAKVFGGANVLVSGTGAFAIGDLNASFVTRFLQQESIPLQSSDLGGDQGRQIHFVGRDFSVYVKRLGSSRKQLVAADESRYLRRRLEQQQTADVGSVTFFDD